MVTTTTTRVGLVTMMMLGWLVTPACAPRGSSFETLGIPRAEERPGRAAVIIGWARERRSGWRIDRIRVDGRARQEWNEARQQPVVLYLAPGEHELRIYASQQREDRPGESAPRRRYRLRPYTLDLLEGQTQLCVLRIGGERRRRPRLDCEALDEEAPGEEEEAPLDENGDEVVTDEDEVGSGQPEGAEAHEDERPAAGQAGEEEVEEPGQFEQADQTVPRRPESLEAEETSGGVPSPFADNVEPPPPPPPASATGSTGTQGGSSEGSPSGGRQLTVEERLERLERAIEELRQELRNR